MSQLSDLVDQVQQAADALATYVESQSAALDTAGALRELAASLTKASDALASQGQPPPMPPAPTPGGEEPPGGPNLPPPEGDSTPPSAPTPASPQRAGPPPSPAGATASARRTR